METLSEFIFFLFLLCSSACAVEFDGEPTNVVTQTPYTVVHSGEEERPAKRARLETPDVQMAGDSASQSSLNKVLGEEGKEKDDKPQAATGCTGSSCATSLARKLSFKSQEC